MRPESPSRSKLFKIFSDEIVPDAPVKFRVSTQFFYAAGNVEGRPARMTGIDDPLFRFFRNQIGKNFSDANNHIVLLTSNR